MKLVSVSMVRDEEYWIWYALTSVYPHVDEILVFDNHSRDRTIEIIRGMRHIADKLTLFEGFGGSNEHDNREAMLQEARRRGGTHVLTLDGDEVHAEPMLAFCRQLLILQEHQPALADPPRNPCVPMDSSPSDGALIKNLALRPIHPGFAGPGTCRPQDYLQPDNCHSAYNYLTRISSLHNLRGNGLIWGQHGFLETDDLYVQASPRTLWLANAWFLHFSHHPRSSRRKADGTAWIRPIADHGSVPIHAHVHWPAALLRPDGPGNPTLESWGVSDPPPGRPRARLEEFLAPA
ncbi:MAG: glycosyltransferase family 2 protein [Planctomycetes bacterium]|nr:glycosyltransferase family 2 protein [Planctomycetota bacterium]